MCVRGETATISEVKPTVALARWNPFDELKHLRDEFNRFFDTTVTGGPRHTRGAETDTWHPAVDMYETEREIVLQAELPGADPKDIEVTVTDDSVSLRGEVRQQHEVNREGFYHAERRYGAFYRAIPLAVEIKPDDARASFEGGVLRVHMPKAEEARKKKVKLDVH